MGSERSPLLLPRASLPVFLVFSRLSLGHRTVRCDVDLRLFPVPHDLGAVNQLATFRLLREFLDRCAFCLSLDGGLCGRRHLIHRDALFVFGRPRHGNQAERPCDE